MFFQIYFSSYYHNRHVLAQFIEALRYKPAGRGLYSNGVTGILHWHNPSFLGSTQPLTEMSTRNISWGGKAAGVYGWQPYHFHVPIVLKSGSLALLEPSGPVQACNGIALLFTWELTPRQQYDNRSCNLTHWGRGNLNCLNARSRGF